MNVRQHVVGACLQAIPRDAHRLQAGSYNCALRTFTLFVFVVGTTAFGAEEIPDSVRAMKLVDYKPQSQLQVKQTLPEKPKFPVIDAHNHVRSFEPGPVIADMDAAGIKTVVNLTGGWGPRLQQFVDLMMKPHPGRFIVFTQIDWKRIDEPDFGAKMAEQLRDSVRRGARGLKQLKELGLTVRDASGKLVTIDDGRAAPIWEEAGRLGIPVAIHVADPAAFFAPLDGTNERIDALMLHPDWNYRPPKFPTHRELMDQMLRLFTKHPNTRFIALHLGWPENLDFVSDMLDRLPNVCVEFGARHAELGRQPRRAKEFFLEYQDRIMFGTDNGVNVGGWRSYYRLLETEDEFFEGFGYPRTGRWKISGLGLPDDVLKKIYHVNFERIMAEFKDGTEAVPRR
jgi:uncharacterized protein